MHRAVDPPNCSPRPAAILAAVGALLVLGCHGPSKQPASPGGPGAPTDIQTLAAFDPAAIGPGAPPSPGPNRPIDVVDHGPQGRSEGNGEIHVRFNQPVVALDIAESVDLADRFTIDPPLPGSAHWRSPELLVFTPAAAPHPAHSYTVRFAGGIVGLDGQRFERALTWSFETPRPSVAGSTPSSHPRDDDNAAGPVERRDTTVFVHFDGPVALAQAQAHLRASARPLTAAKAAATPVPVRVRKPTRKELEQHNLHGDAAERRIYAVQPRTLWPGDSEIEVSVVPGLRGEHGPLPLDTPWSMVFRTYGPQAITSISCELDTPCGLEPIQLSLRNPVEADQLRKITVDPRPKQLHVHGYNDWGDGATEVTIEGQFDPETTYTVRVPAELRDIYGQHIAGGATRQARIAAIPTLALSAATGILRPGPAQTIGVESRHVKAIHVRVGVFTDAEAQAVELDNDLKIPAAFPARVLTRDLPLTPSGKADWSSLALDLADLSGGARHPVLVEVSATALTDRASQYGPPAPVRGLFRLTDLGPVATLSLPGSSVQVLRLSTGAAVPGAKIYRSAPGATGNLLELGVTDASGLLALPAALAPARKGSHSGSDEPPRELRLTVVDPATDDHAHLAVDRHFFDRHDNSDESAPDALRPGERLIARVVSERGVYRPGEKVRVVGWSALDTPFSRSNLGRLKTGSRVAFQLVDHTRKVVATHETRTTAEGKFWAELPVPAEAGLGRYTVQAALPGGTVRTTVKVEDYRVPEFSVVATARRGDILIGEHTDIDVHASYYFGGPVPIFRVSQSTSCDPQRFRPPGLEDIWDVGEDPPDSYRHHGSSGRISVGSPTIDTTPGRRVIRGSGDASLARYPQRCTVSAAVQDVSMQEIGAEASYAVHPAAFYLAVAAPPGHLEAGARVRVPLRAVGPAGERMAAAKVELQVTRSWSERSFKAEGGKRVFDGWVTRTAKVKTCKQDLPAAGADASCALPPLVEGDYELIASASEPGSERTARTVSAFSVYPKAAVVDDDAWLGKPIAGLEVLVQRPQVRPGDTLEVAVRGPWNGAQGNLVLARGGIRETHPLVLVDQQARFKFTVDDTWTPEVSFHATVVQPSRPRGPGSPRLVRATASVHQDFEHRRLKVAVEAPASVRPGEQALLRVRVRDEQDRPSAARVALWAVDEAVLALTRYEVPDLLPTFVSRRQAEISPNDDYERLLAPYVVVRLDPWYATLGLGSTHGSGFGSGHGSSSPSIGYGSKTPPPRARFETTPVFLADLAVDERGEAEVKARLPDNMTTFRITAIASARLVDGSGTGRFGKNDARLLVTAPLVLRAALPRQLRPGDSAELAAIVQNNTGAAGRVTVTAALSEQPGSKGSALELTSPPRATAELDDGGQARVVFQVRALRPGVPELELQASLATSNGSPIRDGLRLPLPVAAERTLTERVAAYGTVDDDQAVAIPIKIPSDVLPGHGGVTVATTSTLLGGLEDAVDALITYPYGCIEQTASRLLPLVALHGLEDYPLGVDDPKEFMRAGVERILAMQSDSGGFHYWPGSRDVHFYASAYATWVLQLAKAAGHPVPEAALDRALDHLETHLDATELAQVPLDWGYHDGVRIAIALHVLADAGRNVSKRAAELYTLRKHLPLFARAFLLMALHRGDPGGLEVRALTSELLASISELPGTAHTSEQARYRLDEYFTSDTRSDAIVLMALLRAEPRHSIVPKLARGLLERRSGGVWRNTQENAYALVALVDYARVYEAELPDFSARAWVGGANVLDAKFSGRELATRTSFTDMATILGLAKPGADPLLPVVLQRQGKGRLYYRLGAEWAPAQADLPARAQGFTITRDLRTRSGAATTSVAVGEPIAMDITVRSQVRVRYVVVDVPLPAGLEGVSRTLGAGRKASVLGGTYNHWVSHEEQRPDRVVVFFDDLPPGTHKHTIDLRSTTRGRFSFPPALAEAMYMPEVYGRTVGAQLEVR